MLTSDSSIRWIESLAEQEVMISAGQRASLDITKTKEDVMAVATSGYVRQLFFQLEYLVRLFNGHVSETDLGIRVLKDGERIDRFALSRNQMSLQVSSSRPGVVQIQCDRVINEGLTGSRTSVLFSGLLEARFGAFDEVEWHFLGNPVMAEQVARHYLTEFIQTSRNGSSLT